MMSNMDKKNVVGDTSHALRLVVQPRSLFWMQLRGTYSTYVPSNPFFVDKNI